MPSGRRPNAKRIEEMTRLRAEGLTFAEIGKRLGVTRQSVETTLRLAGMKQPRQFTVTCRLCRQTIHTGPTNVSRNGPALCLACLAKQPEATFGERLKAARLAAGWTLAELGRRSGIRWQQLGGYERNAVEPRWNTIAALMRVLGTEFLTLGFHKRATR